MAGEFIAMDTLESLIKSSQIIETKKRIGAKVFDSRQE